MVSAPTALTSLTLGFLAISLQIVYFGWCEHSMNILTIRKDCVHVADSWNICSINNYYSNKICDRGISKSLFTPFLVAHLPHRLAPEYSSTPRSDNKLPSSSRRKSLQTNANICIVNQIGINWTLIGFERRQAVAKNGFHYSRASMRQMLMNSVAQRLLCVWRIRWQSMTMMVADNVDCCAVCFQQFISYSS